MKLLLTTNGRLYKNSRGEYYTPIVYGYDFFKRYLNIYEKIKLVAHVKYVPDEYVKNMLRVDGDNLEIFEVDFPNGKLDYIKKYSLINKQVSKSLDGCDVVILRIPDQLAFQVMKCAIKAGLPIGVEVTSNSWEFFDSSSIKSFFRIPLRYLWDYEQKRCCKYADASCYVTKFAIQKRYPPNISKFTTYCSDVDTRQYIYKPREYKHDEMKVIKCIHVAGNIGGVAKGHKEILLAAVELQRKGITLKCTFVGGGDFSKENTDLIRKYNLQVIKTGSLTASQISSEYQNNDIFLFPSYREGLPRVVVEAMASGLPCITTDLEGIKELIDETFMVPVKDYKNLARKIAYVAKNPQILTEQSEKNFLKAEEYSFECLKERRNNFYKFLKEYKK